jgi:predicted ester cyclase
MTIDETRMVVEAYLEGGHGLGALAEDAVFRVMATGQAARGREAIGQLLDYFYHQAFEARAEGINLVVGEGKAVFEGDFTGRQVGEFAGMPPSGREVHVPLCVSYDLADGHIVAARIYFETDALRAQVAAATA